LITFLKKFLICLTKHLTFILFLFLILNLPLFIILTSQTLSSKIFGNIAFAFIIAEITDIKRFINDPTLAFQTLFLFGKQTKWLLQIG
jgi:hypothetical protein